MALFGASLCRVGNELQRHAVIAVPQSGGRRPILEHVPVVAAAARTVILRPWDDELEIQVAVKILNPQLTSDPNRINLLKNECRNTRRLAHPNIVRVFDFHRSEDLAFISMEYINGRDLRFHRSEFKPLDTGKMIKLIQPVINALGYAHERGLGTALWHGIELTRA